MNRDEQPKPSRKISLKYYILTGSIVVTIAVIGLIVAVITRQPSGTLPYPIAKSAAKQLGFDIYYPNQKLLPSGYVLNTRSFDTSNQVLIYSVSYGNNQKIVFSDQAKPTNTQVQAFYAKNLPLNTSLQTKIGVATIGAINTQTVISIPTSTNAWLIATASGNINQQALDQVLESIEISK